MDQREWMDRLRRRADGHVKVLFDLETQAVAEALAYIARLESQRPGLAEARAASTRQVEHLTRVARMLGRHSEITHEMLQVFDLVWGFSAEVLASGMLLEDNKSLLPRHREHLLPPIETPAIPPAAPPAEPPAEPRAADAATLLPASPAVPPPVPDPVPPPVPAATPPGDGGRAHTTAVVTRDEA